MLFRSFAHFRNPKHRECSYTSFYGTISYQRCVFDDCLPVHIDYTYDSYTPFHVIMNNCTFHPSKRHDAIIFGEFLLEGNNNKRREELKNTQWPQITIKDLKIQDSDASLKDVYLIKFLKREYPRELAFPDGKNLPTNVVLRKIQVEESMSFYLTNLECDTKKIE